MVYRQVYDGEWVAPQRKGYRVRCCDCGLVHVIDIRLVPAGRGKQVQFRATRVKTRRRKK